MKAAVLGTGRMGSAIAWSMKELGFFVVGADNNEVGEENFKKHIDEEHGTFYLTDQNDADKMMETALLHEKPDIVISSLPYHQTEEIAYWCIDNELRYCDLGGRVDVSKNINNYAKDKAKKPVFTDLGLAPGWVNILAEWGCSKMYGHQVTDVNMMCGGIPAQRINGVLDYLVTWSVDGLINEYKDDCEILKDGEILKVKALDGAENINGGNMGALEAFYTSGGASHTIEDMQARGVMNCSYRTLRYQGHSMLVRFLMQNLNEDCLKDLLEKACRKPEIIPPNWNPRTHEIGDLVLVKVFVRAGEIFWDKDVMVSNDENGFSAMQKATGFGISSVAKIMAEGKLEGDWQEHRDYWTPFPNNLSYKHVPFEDFNDNLLALGLTL